MADELSDAATRDEADVDEVDDGATHPDELLDLPGGEGYKLNAASEITLHALTNVVLLAGTAECGKTTLLASLYLMFQRKPFAGYLFAGSRTLVGFEKRVHAAKVASQLQRPTTERSKFSELLHLRVRREDRSEAPKDLLLCDLWGEDFREARDSIEGCKRLRILRRADAFVLLIDGAKIAKLDSRQQTKLDALSLLRNALDCEMIAETAEIDVLTTKWDKIVELPPPARADAETFNRHIQNEIQRNFAARVGGIHFREVAAHSPEGTLPLGHGLDDLFKKWVERPTGSARRHLSVPPDLQTACEYDRYLRRRLPLREGSGP